MRKTSKKHKPPKHIPKLLWKLQKWFQKLPTVGKVLIFIIGVPGLYVGFLSALPRMSITAGEMLLNNHLPLSFPFVVSNDGYLDVHSVNIVCHIDSLSTKDYVDVRGFSVGTPSNFDIGDLGAGGRSTTFCEPAAWGFESTKYENGHLTLELSFRPDFLPWRFHRTLFFTGLSDEEGKLHWVESSN